MATNNTRKSIPLATPDYDKNLASLKEYLKGQSTLTDYDFDGSVIMTVLRLLSYNTFENAFYLNQVGNERFLQTAVKRDSVVEAAQDLGYLPRSRKSAVSDLLLNFTTTGNPVSLQLQRGYAQFQATDGVNSFTFAPAETTNVFPNGSVYATQLKVYEGKYLETTYDATYATLKYGFIIPNIGVDTSTMKVFVTENDVGLVEYEYSMYDDINDVGATSRVYFVDEIENGQYKIYFGNGVVSKAMLAGYKIKITYFVATGETANNISKFSFAPTYTITGLSATTIGVVATSAGGSEIEDIDSIKFSAPKNFETQNRACTPSDYSHILRQKYSNIADIISFGGDEIDPPEYGRVLVSIKPKSGLYISSSEKQRIKTDILKRYNVGSVTPVIVDADYIFVKLFVSVYYNPTATLITEAQLQSTIASGLNSYMENFTEKFGTTLRNSVLTRYVDSIDPAILNNDIVIFLEKKSFPVLGTPQQFDIDFGNKIVSGTLKSNKFTYSNIANCYVASDSMTPTNLNLYNEQGSLIKSNIGVADYNKGTVYISALNIQDIPASIIDNRKFFSISAKLDGFNVEAQRNKLIIVNESDIVVDSIEDATTL